jgi:hypothetical protein
MYVLTVMTIAGAIIGKSPATPSLVECREWADKYLWARHEYPWLIHALVDPTFSMFSFAVCDPFADAPSAKQEDEACAPPLSLSR